MRGHYPRNSFDNHEYILIIPLWNSRERSLLASAICRYKLHAQVSESTSDFLPVQIIDRPNIYIYLRNAAVGAGQEPLN